MREEQSDLINPSFFFSLSQRHSPERDHELSPSGEKTSSMRRTDLGLRKQNEKRERSFHLMRSRRQGTNLVERDDH